MSDDLRDQLADALRARWVFRGDAHADELVAALLPVVIAYGDQRAATALRDAADELHVQRFNADEAPDRRWPVGAPREVDSYYAGIVRARIDLRNRADALGDQR